jgi:hypothetical protein
MSPYPAYFQGDALPNLIGRVCNMWLSAANCTYYVQYERREGGLYLLRMDRYDPAYRPWLLNPDMYDPADPTAMREVVEMIQAHADAIRHAASELWDYDLLSDPGAVPPVFSSQT